MNKNETAPYFNYISYLSAKKSIDDRSLNTYVLEKLKTKLRRLQSNKTISILEMGAGTGTMIVRLLEMNLLKSVHYNAIDIHEENKKIAISSLVKFARVNKYEILSASDQSLTLKKDNNQVQLNFVSMDVVHYLNSHINEATYDLVLAHAFMDLIDVPYVMQLLKPLTQRECLYYFSVNYDGLTTFLPTITQPPDDIILTLYHDSMNRRSTEGEAGVGYWSGINLLRYMIQSGYHLIASGSSDWIVAPRKNGYTNDESYFLEFILHTIHNALISSNQIEKHDLDMWIDKRNHQIKKRELIYLAHQLDCLFDQH